MAMAIRDTIAASLHIAAIVTTSPLERSASAGRYADRARSLRNGNRDRLPLLAPLPPFDVAKNPRPLGISLPHHGTLADDASPKEGD